VTATASITTQADVEVEEDELGLSNRSWRMLPGYVIPGPGAEGEDRMPSQQHARSPRLLVVEYGICERAAGWSSAEGPDNRQDDVSGHR